MRTLDHMRAGQRRRIANETLEIYAPIANRLGLNELFRELQEPSFRNKYPPASRCSPRRSGGAANRREVSARSSPQHRTPAAVGIQATVWGARNTSTASTARCTKHLSFSQVLDIYGFRVIVKGRAELLPGASVRCTAYKPVPASSRTIMAIPKANGYQSCTPP